ncbi:MAG: cytidine deaminase [Muribaculaceae bacterium]|nr:cytidine deaminase [Muribaculaceae bacterium]
MKTINFNITALEAEYHELSEQDKALVDAAKNATRNSYAPYSGFRVGAAILLDNGTVITGSNQENAAFPSGTCAERSACFYAAAQHPGVPFKKIAIAAWPSGKEPSQCTPQEWESLFQALPISPCGACRQALLEYENKYSDIQVILFGREKVYIFPSIKSLLPFSFVEF